MHGGNGVVKEMTATEKLLERIKPSAWIACPVCGVEWSRLMPCTYWIPGEPAEKETHVCVRCAEGVRALPTLEKQIPIPGVDVKIMAKKTYKNNPIALHELPTSWWATVSYGDLVVKIDPVSSGQLKVVYGSESDKPVFYKNIFQAWIAMKVRIEKGEDVDVKKTWNGKFRKGLFTVGIILLQTARG